MQNLPRRAIVGSVLFILGVLACSSRDNPDERTATNKEHLTQSELGRVLSFEGTLGSTGDWIASSGTVASSTAHASAGTHSMVTSGAYSVSVTSTTLSALGSVGAKMSLDIWLPSALAALTNKGNIQAYFTSNTLQLSAYSTSNVQLTSLTPGQFSRIDIPLDSTLKSKLSQSGYSDLTIKFTFNLADVTHQTFVDNLVFSSGGTGTGGSTGIGGTNAVGGAGGTRALGGTASTLINSGGTTSNGGTASLGGTKTSGGSTIIGNGGAPVGGAPGNGGTLGLAGAIGYTGGTVATGGVSSTAAASLTGGAPGIGGTASGGVSTANTSSTGTGGSPTGGSTSTGGTGATGGGTGYTFSFQLPKGVTRSQVLFATTEGDLSIEDGVNAYDGSGYASVSSVSEGRVNRIGVASQVQNVWSDGDVQLANNATVHGTLTTSGSLDAQAGAHVLGTTTEQADLTEVETVSWTVNLPTNTSPAVSLTAAQTLSPGQYPEYDVKSGGILNLSTGTYTFNSLMFDTGSVLNIDNSLGAVFIYLLNGFTFRGTINPKAAKANVLFGAAGTNPVVIETAFTGIVVAPKASITLATVPTLHKGAFFAQSIVARKNTTITLSALQSSNFCTPSDACSSFCPCASGATKACTSNASCESGSVCGSGNGAAFGLPASTNVCWAATCAATGGLGSGCARFLQACQADSDCSSGQVCGAANGAQFQYVSSRICWPTQCGTDPVGTGCGTVQSACGLCPSTCTPNCASKKCGDSADDGCGGTCIGYCKNGDAGCTDSVQCTLGSICSPTGAAYYGKGTGVAVCWPTKCASATFTQRECGTATSVCGPQCPSTAGQCANRQCGTEPTFGTNCGVCETGQYCDPSGKCQVRAPDIIKLPVPTPSLPPTTTPVATDVGAIPGTLAVSTQGKAHYSVPLFVSPGVGGLTPELSLEYESELQDGDLGVGWSVGGLSVIARCPRAYGQGGLLPAKDPITYFPPIGESRVQYVDTDQFCLDGKALVLVSSSTGEYRTEQDSLVRVFVRMNGTAANTVGPDHFDVYLTDGRLLQYGGASQAFGFEGRNATGTLIYDISAGVKTIWALSHVQDLRGNTIDYVYHSVPTVQVSLGKKYEKPLGSVQGTRPQIDQILYGGSAAFQANRRISFEWQSLWNDSSLIGVQRYGWNSGHPYQTPQRLSAIGMYYEEEEIRKYMLQYDNGDLRRSKLSNLYECGQQHCKQPTKFTYNSAPSISGMTAIDLSNVHSVNLGINTLKAIQSILDADGDGLPDLLLNPNLDPSNAVNCNADFVFARATGDRLNPYSYTALPHGLSTCDCTQIGDLDNDGKSEIYARPIDKSQKGSKLTYDSVSKVWLQEPHTSSISCKAPFTDLDGEGIITVSDNRYPVDFAIDTDGDGVPNEISTYHAREVARHQTFDEFVDVGISIQTPSESAASQDSYIRAHMNGGQYCQDDSCVPTPQPFRTQDWATGMKVIDVNGDGLKDILTWSASATGSTGSSSYLNLWINTGRNQFTGGYAVGPLMASGDKMNLDKILNAWTFQQAFVYDVNRDGLEDLVFMTNWEFGLSALIAVPDDKYGATFQLQSISSIGLPSWFRAATSRVLALDVNSDGATDLLMGDGNNIAVAFQTGADHDLLQTVTNGNGRKQTIHYISGKATKDYTDTLPQTAYVSKPVHVLPPTVQMITTDKADGLQLTETYKYKEARIGYYGRGLLGFTEIHKAVAGNDIGTVSDEYTYYHPDSLVQRKIGESAENSYIYYEVGRPWKHVLEKHRITSGLGASSKTVDDRVTETRTLQEVSSPANVPMWVLDHEAVTESEFDSQGNEQVLVTSETFNYVDGYGLSKMVTHRKTGPNGDTLEAQDTSTTYERDSAFLDQNLVALPVSSYSSNVNANSVGQHNETRDYYDNGLIHHVTTEPDVPYLSIATEYIYNSRGNATSVIQTAGSERRETDAYYDGYGDLVQTTLNPLLQTTAYDYYRGYGQIALRQDPNGLSNWRGIDTFGRETGTMDPNGNIVATTYEPPGTEANFLTYEDRRSVAYAVRKVRAGLSWSVTFYDSDEHNIGVTTSDVDVGSTMPPLHLQNYYDSLGRKTYRSHAPFYDNGPSEQQDHLVYDNLNRPTSITVASDATPNKHATYVMSYGPALDVTQGGTVFGTRAVTTTFPNQSAQTRIFDVRGRTLSMIDRNGSVASYTYDVTGGVRTFTDQDGLIVRNSYDRFGRVVVTQDPLRGEADFVYSALGGDVRKYATWGNVHTQYDALNRPTTEDTAEGRSTWTYDNEPGAIGRLVNVNGPATIGAPQGHSVHYTYGQNLDTQGNRGAIRRVTTTIGSEQFSTDYDYDLFERLSTTRYPALSNGLRYAVTNKYSPAGRLQAIVEADGGQGRTLWQVKAWDALGRKKSEQALGVMSTDYEYTDIDGLVSDMTTVEGKYNLSLDYRYDVEHNVTRIGSSQYGQYTGMSRYYQYDASGRITDEFYGDPVNGSLQQGALIDHIDYSPNGNIASKSDVGPYTYGDTVFSIPYAVIDAGGYTFEYDQYGRLTKRSAPYIPSGEQAITWTSFDAPSTITTGDHVQTSYEYNGLKERVLETGLTQRKYRVGAYQRTDNLASGERLHSLLINAGSSPIAEVRFTDDGAGTVSTANVYSMLSDKMGSTRIVRDPDGNHTARNYDAFGKASNETLLDSGIGFAGYKQDDERALLWMNNRPYDAVIGRVLAADPIINGAMGQDGANRYAYVYNHPTAFIDPSGFSGLGWSSGLTGGDITSTNPLSYVSAGSVSGGVALTYVNNVGALSPIQGVPDGTPSELAAPSPGSVAVDPCQVAMDELTGTCDESRPGSPTAASGEGANSAGTVPANAADSPASGTNGQSNSETATTAPTQLSGETLRLIQEWAPGQGESVPENPEGWLLFNTVTGSAQNWAGASTSEVWTTGMNGADSGRYSTMAPAVGVPASAGLQVSGGFFMGTSDQFQQSVSVYVGGSMIFGGELDVYVGPGNSWGMSIGGQVGIGYPVYFGMTMPTSPPNPR